MTSYIHEKLLPFVLLLTATATISILPTQAEMITSFHSDVTVKSDTTVNISEHITVDFEHEERHGITRHIPIAMKRRGIPYVIDFKLSKISDESGKPIPFHQYKDGADVDLKIGDPNITLTGKHTYVISYRLRRVINFFAGRPELYLNITGDQSGLIIEKADARVYLPPNVQLAAVGLAAFQGPPGATKPAHSTIKDGKILYSSDQLPAGQGLTIGLSMPPGSVTEPTEGERLFWFLRDWWQTLVIPLGAVAIMYLIWMSAGRDVGGGKAIAVEWNPPKGLTPAEVGTLVDEKCDLQDITSMLVDLAVRGHLKIEEVQSSSFFFLKSTDHRFTKTDPPKDDIPLTQAEELFLAAVFTTREAGSSVLLSSLKGSFYPYLTSIKEEIYRRMTGPLGLFRTNPEQTRSIYAGAAIFIALTSLFFFLEFGAGRLWSYFGWNSRWHFFTVDAGENS